MYLKSIEVQGFKSFANKIVFDFHNGITGIVGPNGSGKSNVADAVRWVLGEQRIKQLRGGSMQDVIFSGTETRKPLSYASVAITLDNSDHKLPVDFEEVKVTRKLYRSGESEYLLNGSPCRLKDINEMFYDTGIGKEGYSIIGQGQIDKILSGKPEEKRELFDEAAGIVKFKRRKNMSLKKLEEEQQNLVRVRDILSELERQYEPLQRQSEKAKEYLKKKEELKRFDINMFLMETLRLKNLLKDLEEKIQIAEDDLNDSKSKQEEMKAQYESIEDEKDAIDAKIESANSQLNSTMLLRQQLVSQVDLLNEQINSAKSNDEHYAQRTSSIQKDLDERNAQKEKLEIEQASIEATLKEEYDKHEQARKKLIDVQTRIANLTVEIEKNQSNIVELLNNRASTKAKIQHFDTMMEHISVQQEQLQKRLSDNERDKKLYEDLYKKYENELKDISAIISNAVSEMKDVEQKIDVLNEEISNKKQSFDDRQKEYHREQSRLDSLKNMTERYDGYGNSIRRVMERKKTEPGILGVVADLIKVDKKYEVAIETALGGSIQNIVTTDENVAKKMIGYLKQNKLGRATFLPLTAMRTNQSSSREDVLKEQGVIGTADQLVKVENKYISLAENLLRKTIVVDHIDTGIMLSRKYHQSLRMVTLEGDLLNPGGAMSGGAFKNSSNLLSRRREIEELEKNVLHLQGILQELKKEIDNLRSKRTDLYGKLEYMQQEQQKAYVIQNTAKMNLDQTNVKHKQTLQTAQSIYRERTELDKQLEHIVGNQESIQVELETSERLEEELNHIIEKLQLELEQKRVDEADESRKNEEIRLSYSSLEQKQNFVEENLSRIHEECVKFEGELQLLNASKGSNEGEIESKQAQIDDLKKTIDESKELLEEINQEIKKSQKDKEELTLKYRAFLGKKDSISNHIVAVNGELVRLLSRKEGYEEAIERQMNYMWDEYELTYNRAMDLHDSSMTDLSVIKKRIQELKAEIKGLGSVNVNAIEDFKNLAERYEFMKAQHDDLIEAEATLKQIIEELDTAMRKQFTEEFAKINAEFNHVFKQLFGGGKGTLELMDDEDVLEAGIRIIAQPPGKKLQNMMQLSGGEKALTAIALLFAIQNLKPSPFCLLDEIEAALDDSNVTRFAEYLHKLTKYTQFIVITHRRGTMTAADRLYGITMQEKGVSTLVSVDLLEQEESKS